MAIPRDEIAQAVEGFIRSHFGVPDTDPNVHRDAHLYEGGVVDSAGVVELIAFVESRFDVKLDDEDLFSDLFTTINGISDVVLTRLRDGGSGTGQTDGVEEVESRQRMEEAAE